ncbi:hypothetical protein B0J18DRAFT_421712 [Chaetomium sp. MPI-SDFR-AT-0129]|nr:hypothetical protein B0J18DRAFT_421712 [Chaetomium sp. MPI-SDFR-AT-0129]
MTGPQIGACSICRDLVEESLIDIGILNYTKKVRKNGSGKTVFTINIAGGPDTWPTNSLAAMCWRQLSLDFHYHHQKRKGDMICCSNF